MSAEQKLYHGLDDCGDYYYFHRYGNNHYCKTKISASDYNSYKAKFPAAIKTNGKSGHANRYTMEGYYIGSTWVTCKIYEPECTYSYDTWWYSYRCQKVAPNEVKATTFLGKIDVVVDNCPVVGTVYQATNCTVALCQGDLEGAKQASVAMAMNAGGDIAGAVSGGSGKAGMIALKAGAKVVVTQGVKAAGKAAIKSVAKNCTKTWVKETSKKYFKKEIKKHVKDQLREGIETLARDDLEKLLAEGLGLPVSDLTALTDAQINTIAIHHAMDNDISETMAAASS